VAFSVLCKAGRFLKTRVLDSPAFAQLKAKSEHILFSNFFLAFLHTPEDGDTHER
jgi:hypothetical protein